MRLAILGGGGFRVPLVYQALLASGDPDIEVRLHDCDAQRLAVIGSVLAGLAEGFPEAPRVCHAASLDAALEGADFVFSAIRVGGLAGRERDERIALDLGVLGQETTGPGGIAFGLRTIPVAMHIAERVRKLCPEAYVLNFTNPAGMITEAMQRVLGERVIGICDTPSGLARRVAAALGLDPALARFDYVGLNHLGWLRGVRSDAAAGQDLLPALLADDGALATLEETDIFGADWIRTLGCVPNEYLYYYYFNREAVRAICAQDAPRAAFLTRQQNDFYAAAAASPGRALELWRRASDKRRSLYMAEARGGDARRAGGHPAAGAAGEGGYSGVALAVLQAISSGEPATMILNVRNGGALAGLDDDAIVELPAVVDSAGAHPLPATPPTLSQLGLMQQVKGVERLTIEAATTGSADAALQAFAQHPLVDSVSVARRLVDACTPATEIG
jgi:6-phospho-beta-glucosidase